MKYEKASLKGIQVDKAVDGSARLVNKSQVSNNTAG